MKIKSLAIKFSYTDLKELWVDKKGYRLPNLEEAQLLDTHLDYFWIQSNEDEEYNRILYNRNTDRLERSHKDHKHPAVVIKDVDIVVDWGVSTGRKDLIIFPNKESAKSYLESENNFDERLVKITKEYYR